jgi:UDP-N-acetylglucosamine 2-epimerase
VPAGLVLAAQRHRTPTVYVQHGLLSETFRTQPSLPHTRFLVFSEHAREQIAASGVAREAVEVVGHAGYDALARRETEHPEAARLRSLTDGAQRVLLLLTQPDEGLRGLAGGAWIEHALEAATRIDGCRVIVKVHPRDRRASAYAALAAELGGDVRIVPHAEAKLPQLWPLCDAVALGYSTAALEAVIVGKPVVSINLTGADDCYPFAASGAVLAARTPGEILPLLRAALTDEQTRQQLMQRRAEFIERHVGPLDGRAAERMARIILDIARQRTVDESSATPET